MRTLPRRGSVVSCLHQHALTVPFPAREAGDMAIRVVLGEDNFLAREAIRGVLERTEGSELIAAYGEPGTPGAAIDETHPVPLATDSGILQVSPDAGVRLAAELRSSHPEMGGV